PAHLKVEVGIPSEPTSSVNKGTLPSSTPVPTHGADPKIDKRQPEQRVESAARDAHPLARAAARSPAQAQVDVGSINTVGPVPGAELLDAFIQEQRTAGFCACPTVSGPFLSLALTQAFSSVPWSTVRLDVGYTMLLNDYAIRLQVLRTQRTPPIYWSLVLDSEQRILDRLRFWIAHGYVDEVLQQGRDLLPLRPPHRFPPGQEDCQTKAEAPSGSHSPSSHGPSAPQAQRPLLGSTAEQRTAVTDSELERQVTARRLEPEIQPTSGQEESAPIARPYGTIVQDLRRKYEDGLQAQAAASLITASFSPASPEAADAADDRLPPPKSSRVGHISENIGSKQHRTDSASDEPAIKAGHQLVRPNQLPKDADQSRTATTCQPTNGADQPSKDAERQSPPAARLAAGVPTACLPSPDEPVQQVGHQLVGPDQLTEGADRAGPTAAIEPDGGAKTCSAPPDKLNVSEQVGTGATPAGSAVTTKLLIHSASCNSSYKCCSAASMPLSRSACEQCSANENVPPDVRAPSDEEVSELSLSPLIFGSVASRLLKGNRWTTITTILIGGQDQRSRHAGIASRKRSPPRKSIVGDQQHDSIRRRPQRLPRAVHLASIGPLLGRSPTAHDRPAIVCGGETMLRSSSHCARASSTLCTPLIGLALSDKAALDHVANAISKVEHVLFGDLPAAIDSHGSIAATCASLSSPGTGQGCQARGVATHRVDLSTIVSSVAQPAKKAPDRRRQNDHVGRHEDSSLRPVPSPSPSPSARTATRPTGPGPPTRARAACGPRRWLTSSDALLRSGNHPAAGVQQPRSRRGPAATDGGKRQHLEHLAATAPELAHVRKALQAPRRAPPPADWAVPTDTSFTRSPLPVVALRRLPQHMRAGCLSITKIASRLEHRRGQPKRQQHEDEIENKQGHGHEQWHGYVRAHAHAHASKQAHQPGDAIKTRPGPVHDPRDGVLGLSVTLQRRHDQQTSADMFVQHDGHVAAQRGNQRAGDGVVRRAA
ncbi:hypothetical protein OC834_007428, partial [Tilletia horrida]